MCHAWCQAQQPQRSKDWMQVDWKKNWPLVFSILFFISTVGIIGLFALPQIDDIPVFFHSTTLGKGSIWGAMSWQYANWSHRYSANFLWGLFYNVLWGDFPGMVEHYYWQSIGAFFSIWGAWVLLAYALCQNAESNGKKFLLGSVLFCIYLITMQPFKYTQTLYWLSGGAVYLSANAFFLTLTALLLRIRQDTRKKWLWACLTLPLAFMAAGCSELVNGLILIMLLLFMGDAYLQKKCMRPYLLAVFGVVLGMIVMLSSPGLRVRLSLKPPAPEAVTVILDHEPTVTFPPSQHDGSLLGFIKQIPNTIKKTAYVSSSLLANAFNLFLLGFLLLRVGAWSPPLLAQVPLRWAVLLCFLIAIAGVQFVLWLFNTMVPRVYSSIITVQLVWVFLLLVPRLHQPFKNLLQKTPLPKMAVAKWLPAFFALFFIFSAPFQDLRYQLRTAPKFHKEMKERLLFLHNTAEKNPRSNAVVPPLVHNPHILLYAELDPKPTHGINTMYSYPHLNLNTVRLPAPISIQQK